MCDTKVTFLHPDLGIGGAEKLVVDAALALRNKGYKVNFVTSHHDPTHCFLETKDGTLPVFVAGDWIPRSICGRFFALFAYIRMIYAASYLVIAPFIDNNFPVPDVVFCDQISACIPILHLRYKHVLFYCHFPDQLLSAPGSVLKTLYRAPINWLEEATTGCADKILVNSNFTRSVFKNTFKNLLHVPEILYPSVNTKNLDSVTEDIVLNRNLPATKDSLLILSINRYERKKNLRLAIAAFHELKTNLNKSSWEKVHLYIAGGYDTRVKENVEHFHELTEYVKDLNVTEKVHFLKSLSDLEKNMLLNRCDVLVYTPSNEHFGIVPLEAMFSRKPVVAVNSGGPVETIVNGVTGFLCEPKKEDFAQAIARILEDCALKKQMGDAGHVRFKENFSFEAFSNKLHLIIEQLIKN